MLRRLERETGKQIRSPTITGLQPQPPLHYTFHYTFIDHFLLASDAFRRYNRLLNSNSATTAWRRRAPATTFRSCPSSELTVHHTTTNKQPLHLSAAAHIQTNNHDAYISRYQSITRQPASSTHSPLACCRPCTTLYINRTSLHPDQTLTHDDVVATATPENHATVFLLTTHITKQGYTYISIYTHTKASRRVGASQCLCVVAKKSNSRAHKHSPPPKRDCPQGF